MPPKAKNSNAKKLKDLSKCTTFMRVNTQVNTIHNGREI